MTKRVVLTALLGTVATLLTVIGPTSTPAANGAEQACTISAKLVNSCRPWLGAESGAYISGGFRAQMLEHEARIGRQLDIVHEYLGPNAVLTNDVVTLAKRPGTMALVNWRVADRWADADGRSAAVNNSIDAMANSIKALGSTKIFLTVFHEPENDISPGGDPDCPTLAFAGSSGATSHYVDMWHNVRARFNALGVANVVWVMNYMGWKGWNCVIENLWPGNSYVDWVMWDPYPRNATWTNFVNSFYNFLLANNDATHNFMAKPWGLAEFGYVGSSQTAAYAMYDEARRNLQNGVHPRLKAYVVWDQHTSVSHDDRVGYTENGVKDPTEQAHYNAFANDPLLGGGGATTPPAPSVDTTPPTRPTSLRATPGIRQISLTWTAATDNVGVDRYYLFRGNSKYRLLGNVTSYTDTNLTTGTTYTYKVYAIDSAGNWSASSGNVSATAK